MDWSKHVGATGRVLESRESGRDVGLNLGNSVEVARVAAARGREQLSGNLCAVFFGVETSVSNISREIFVRFDPNLSKRVEVTESGLVSHQIDGISRAGFARHSTVVSKDVDLCSLSPSGQDLNVDLRYRVDAGKSLDCTGSNCQPGRSRQ